MNYYQKNKEKLKDKYYNQGVKERAKEYYQANKDVIKEKARIRYQNLPEEQKKLIKQRSRDRYKELIIKIKQFFISQCIKYSQNIVFGDKKVNKKEFYSSKQAILLDDGDVSKIFVSNKWEINDTSKFFIGYLNKSAVRPICVILPQMSEFFKYFEYGNKNMSFKTEDESVYLKYSKIWDGVKKLLKLKYSADPVHDKKYIVTKLNVFNGVNNTTFTNEKIPKERNH